MKIVAGLDFGTSNSALAITRDDKTQVLRINNRESAERTLRSVIHIDEDRTIEVGQRAIDQYIEFQGLSGRFLQSIKAFLPQSTFAETRIFGRRYELEDLVAIILREIKSLGENALHLPLEEIIMGRPVLFSEDTEKDALAERRLRTAAERAGFKSVQFELEPIAATLAYRSTLTPSEQKIVLMGDFGGGTSDFCVMSVDGKTLTQTERRKSVLSTGGVYIGGDTFDKRIMWEKVTPHFGRDVTWRGLTGNQLEMPVHLVRSICEWHQIPFMRDRATLATIRDVKRTASNPGLVANLENLILENKGFMVFQAIERAKKELATESEATINYTDRDIIINEKVTRGEFEGMIRDDLEAIKACVSDTLQKAGATEQDIDMVLLTGGSSFIPAVQRIFTERFGEVKLLQMDAFTSVAQGLALSGT